jgi:transcriptional regulator with XRE-family HTH domain
MLGVKYKIEKIMSNAHPVDVHVGRRLRLRRTVLGMSQETIGSAIGVSFQQVQKYERGINRMGSSRLYDFAKLLKVSVGYFFDGFGDNYSENNMVEALGAAENDVPKFEHEEFPNREVMDIIRSYYRIKSPAMRKRIADLIKAMAEESTELQ